MSNRKIFVLSGSCLLTSAPANGSENSIIRHYLYRDPLTPPFLPLAGERKKKNPSAPMNQDSAVKNAAIFVVRSLKRRGGDFGEQSRAVHPRWK
jgi:hypothetical protein